MVDGTVDAYVHAGGQYEWDSAAPVAVARAAGLHATRLDGSPLEYNQPDPWLPDLLVCRPGVEARAAPPPGRGRLSAQARSGQASGDQVLSQLRALEAESIHIIREVAAEMERPCCCSPAARTRS